jgi:hypothetical protein
MIKVYQIQLTDSEITVANEGGSTPKLKAYFDRSFDSTFKVENFEHYTHVANVFTDDMEYAFEVMNLWDDDTMYEFMVYRPSSMSVGDILVAEDGAMYRCASFGFDKI